MSGFLAKGCWFSLLTLVMLATSVAQTQDAERDSRNAVQTEKNISTHSEDLLRDVSTADDTVSQGHLLAEIDELQGQLRDLYEAELNDSSYTESFYQWLSEAADNPESVAHILLRALEDRSDDLAQISRTMEIQSAASDRTRRRKISPETQELIDSLGERLFDKLKSFEQDARSVSDAERVERWNKIKDLQAKIQVLQSE